MLKVTGNQIELTRGDTARLNLSVTRENQSYDFSSDTVVLTVKTDPYATTPLFQVTAANGVIVIPPESTRELDYGTYVYDVQLTTQSGDVCTIIEPSKFILKQEVSWQG